MPAQNQRPWPGAGGPTQFTTTHWSVVLAAADNSSPDAQAALEELCRTYWFPLYAFVRRRGLDPHTAQDVVQGFFAQLLERQSFRNRTPEQGRFRSFLLASLKYYLADLADYEHAAKRGGGQYQGEGGERDLHGGAPQVRCPVRRTDLRIPQRAGAR